MNICRLKPGIPGYFITLACGVQHKWAFFTYKSSISSWHGVCGSFLGYGPYPFQVDDTWDIADRCSPLHHVDI